MKKEELDVLNGDLESATAVVFESKEAAIEAICLSLEKNGITFPKHLISEGEDEAAYKLMSEGDEEPHFLYIAIDEFENVFEAYATIATEDEMEVLNQLDEDVNDE